MIVARSDRNSQSSQPGKRIGKATAGKIVGSGRSKISKPRPADEQLENLAVVQARTPEPAATAKPEAELTLHASRRFWLFTLGGLIVVGALVQGYGYFTGWGDPERLVQRYFTSAQRLTLAKRYDAAIRQYEKILKSKTGPDNIRQALIGMGDLLRERQEWDQAVEYYSKLRSQDAGSVLSAWAGLQIGEVQLQAGKLNEALQTFDQISRQYPKSDWDAEARLGRGKVLEKQEEYEAAIAAYEQLAAQYGGGFLAAEAMVRIGQCYELEGDVAAARKAYQTVLDQYPSSTWDDAKARLQRLEAGKAAEGVRVWGQEKP